MSSNIPALYTQQFSTNVALLSQQRSSKFEGSVSVASNYTGKQASPVNQVGSIEMQPVGGRFQPKQQSDAPVDRRWVSPQDWDLTQRIDTFDKLKSAVELNSAEVAAAVAARNRRKDYTLINAFFATAQTSATGFASGTMSGLP